MPTGVRVRRRAAGLRSPAARSTPAAPPATLKHAGRGGHRALAGVDRADPSGPALHRPAPGKSRDTAPAAASTTAAAITNGNAETGARGQGAAEHRDADGPARLDEGLVDPGRGTGLGRWHRRHDQLHARGDGDALDRRRAPPGRPRPSARWWADTAHADQQQGQGHGGQGAADHGPLTPTAGGARGAGGGYHCRQRHRREAQPGDQGAAALRSLDPLRQGELGAEHGEEHPDDGQRPGPHAPVAGHRRRHHGRPGPPLLPGEQRHEGGGPGERRHHQGRPPTPYRALDDGEQQQRQRHRPQDRSAPVDGPGDGRPGPGQEHRDRDQGDRHHRHVDQEHRAPPEMARAGRRRRSGPIAAATPATPVQMAMARPRSASLKMLPSIDKVAGMVAAPPRPIAPRASASCSGLDVKAAAGRGGSKHRQARQQQPPPPEPVADDAQGQQQTRQGQGVGRGDPLQVGLGGVQLPPQRGQGHIQDGVVDDDDAQRQAQHRQPPPAAGVVMEVDRGELGAHRRSAAEQGGGQVPEPGHVGAEADPPRPEARRPVLFGAPQPGHRGRPEVDDRRAPGGPPAASTAMGRTGASGIDQGRATAPWSPPGRGTGSWGRSGPPPNGR